MKSAFTNSDHQIVKLMFFTSGTENMSLYQGQTNNIDGPDGTTFKYAWKDRDELITADEFDEHGTEGVYGEDYNFGSLPGQVP